MFLENLLVGLAGEAYHTAGRTELHVGPGWGSVLYSRQDRAVLVFVLLWCLLKLPQTPSFLQGWRPLRDCPYLCGGQTGRREEKQD